MNQPDPSRRAKNRDRRVLEGMRTMEILWILLGIAYVVCWIFLGLATFRKGHYWLFWIGFIFPILWIIGALIRPTARAAGRYA